MKIKKGFVLEKVGDSYLACATGKLAREFSAYIRLNETGAYLWELLSKKDLTEEDLVKNITEEYDISEELASADVKAFAAKLKDAGIVE